MIARIQVRRDLSTEWTANNISNPIILALGEIGYETDTNRFKIGDGTNDWSQLNYELGQWNSDSSGNITYGSRVDEGNVTVESDLIVTGNLTVNGTTTTINTEEVTIEDNMVVLNSNLTGAPPAGLDSGIEVNLGTSGSTKLYWDQATSKWTVEGDLNVQGDIFSNNNAMWTLNGSDIYYDQGSVGIGTDSPATLLHLKDLTPASDNVCLRLENSDQIWDLCNRGFDGDKFTIYDVTADNVPFKIETSSPTNSFYIKSDGSVGIGTSNPSAKLDVAGEINFSGSRGSFVSSLSQPRIYRSGSDQGTYPFDDFGHLIIQPRTDGSNRDIVFATGTNGANLTVIDSDGNVGIGTTSPSSLLEVRTDSANTATLSGTSGLDDMVIRGSENVGLMIVSKATSLTASSSAATINFACDVSGGGTIVGSQDTQHGFIKTVIDTASEDTSMHLGIKGNEYLSILDGGNVGIGTSSPQTQLQVHNPTNAAAYSKFSNVNTGVGVTDGTTVGVNTAGDFQIWNYESNEIQMATNGQQRLTIDSSGKVGIGTSSPHADLHIHTTGDGTTKLQLTDGISGSGTHDGLVIGMDTDQNGYFWQQENTDIKFGTNNTEKMRIKGDGKVGIGDTTPAEKLEVNGAIKLGTTSSTNAGTIRWSGTDFEGYDGASWNSLTSSGVVSSQWTTSGSDIYYNTGNVGVGTTSPGAKIDIGIGATGSLGLRVTSLNDAAVTGDHISAAALRGNTNAYNLLNLTNSTGTKFIVQGDGKVGVGTNSPDGIFHAKSSGTTAENVAAFGNGTINSGLYVRTDDGNLQWGLSTLNQRDLFFSTDQTRRMTIDGVDGNVGIGTSTPQRLLTLGDGTGSPHLLLYAAPVGNSRIEFGDTNDQDAGRIQYNHSTNHMNFSTAGVQDRMVLDDNGRLGIGVTSPSEKLDVVGNITATGTITSSSDIALKENIELISDPIEKVKELSGYTFNKKGEDLRLVGLIAQEVEKVLPEAVAENQEGLKSVAYGNLVALLVECVKKQDERIDQLEKTIEKLK